MSDAGLGNVLGFVDTVFMKPYRSIGGIIAEVTIEESGRDELMITEHPVEQGAPIADHAFKRPAEVVMHCGWSEGGSGFLGAQGGVYGALLSWQAALVPFDLFTGKRWYPNMLIAGLVVETDEHSEHALMATITCREIILVSSQTVTGSGGDANTAAPSSGLSQRTDSSTSADTTAGTGSGLSQRTDSGAGLDTAAKTDPGPAQQGDAAPTPNTDAGVAAGVEANTLPPTSLTFTPDDTPVPEPPT
jgi:hypothetical protein